VPYTLITDNSVPAETRVYYSKKKPAFETITLCVCFLLGAYFLIFEDGFENKGFGFLLCIVAGVFLNVNYSKANNTSVQLLITNKGMQTPDTDFYTWEQITGEGVTEEQVKGNTNYFLNYEHANGSERMLISNLDVSPKEIEKLISIYRGRNGK
jgi:hypothetical protein